MSVDYYSCQVCGDARYEEAIISCENCGASICNHCVVYDPELGDDCDYYFPDYVRNEDGELKKEYCPYCSGKVVDDNDLLNFIAKKYNIDLSEAKKEYLESKI